MAELQLPKLTTRVRFPSSAPQDTNAFIAQSVERIHGKDEVIGSIPIKGSRIQKGLLHKGVPFVFWPILTIKTKLPAMDALCRNGSTVRKRERQVMQEARAVRRGAYAVREYRNGEKRRSRTPAIPLPDASMVRLRSSSIPFKGSNKKRVHRKRRSFFVGTSSRIRLLSSRVLP